jgi:hypothetical protein
VEPRPEHARNWIPSNTKTEFSTKKGKLVLVPTGTR